MNLARLSPLLVALTLLGGTTSFAQVTTGTPPFGTFASNSSPDVIDLANLNAHLAIPVLHKAGRGTDFTYDLSYDSSVWYPVTSNSITTWEPVQNLGWRGQTEIATGYVSYATLGDRIGTKCFGVTYINFVYHDPWGVPHPFSGEATSQTEGNYYNCGNHSFNGFTSLASDGSGYTLFIGPDSTTSGNFPGGAVYGRDGKTIAVPFNLVYGASNFVDRNGNEISVNGSGQFFDTLSSTTAVLTVSGSGTPSSPMKFTYTAPSGAQASYTLNYTNYTVATNFGLSGTNEYKSSAAVPLVTSVVLPDGNGTLGKLVITDPLDSSNAQTCNYTHDDLTRIASANCGSIWFQSISICHAAPSATRPVQNTFLRVVRSPGGLSGQCFGFIRS